MSDKRVITQRRLSVLVAARAKVERLRQALKREESLAESLERSVVEMLVIDATVEPGRYSAGLQTKMGNCTPKWKELYIGHMQAEHGTPEAVTEEKARALYPAQSKTVLNVVDTKARP